MSDGTRECLNGEDRRSTNAIIRSYVGTYEDFVLTSLSVQNQNSQFIETGQTDRKDLLSQFIGLTIFDRLFNYFTNTTGIKIKKELDIIHLHNYKQGNKFIKHKDNLYPTQIHNIGVCLNDDYVGGEFVLYEPDELLPKKQGELYTFESLRLHEVKKIESGERWSIIAFLHNENLELKKRLL